MFWMTRDPWNLRPASPDDVLRCRGATLTDVVLVVVVLTLGAVLCSAGLERVRNDARVVDCQANLRLLSVASHAYAADESQQLLHHRQSKRFPWYSNAKWRTIAGLKLDTPPTQAPTYMLCPERPIKARVNLARTYAQNWTDIRAIDEPEGKAIYIDVALVKEPSKKVHFADANSWEINWRGADYARMWKVHGEKHPSEGGAFGVVAYRHQEAANAVRFDGSSYLYSSAELFPLQDGTPLQSKIDVTWHLYGPAN